MIRFLLTTAVLFAAIPGIADDKNAGWTVLFNGKDLKGWVQRNGTATYVVKDGAILGTTKDGSPNSFLCTKKDYTNFELEFEVMVDDRLNSGVQFRSKSLESFKKGRVHGPQVEIEKAPGESGYIYSEGTGQGWLSKDLTKNKNAFKNGKWNKYRVKAAAGRLRTWVNGTKIEDLTLSAENAKRFASGFIGLQVHGFRRAKDAAPAWVKWRNIRIREFD